MPCLPVNPWQMTRVFLLIRIDIVLSLLPGDGRDDLLRGVGHVVEDFAHLGEAARVVDLALRCGQHAVGRTEDPAVAVV